MPALTARAAYKHMLTLSVRPGAAIRQHHLYALCRVHMLYGCARAVTLKEWVTQQPSPQARMLVLLRPSVVI